MRDKPNGQVHQASEVPPQGDGVLKIEVLYNPADQGTTYVLGPGWNNLALANHVLQMAAEIVDFNQKVQMSAAFQQRQMQEVARQQIAMQQGANLKKLIGGP